MKIKIRKYEQLIVVLLGLMTSISYLLQHFGFVVIYQEGFNAYLKSHPGLRFNYPANLLLLRTGIVMLLVFIYLWINLYMIPRFLRAAHNSVVNYLWVLIQLLMSGYLLAIGVNAASFYAHPAWNNYGEFKLLALFGYNEFPLSDLWFGFGRALLLLTVYMTYAVIREFMICRLENSGPGRTYRILITNRICAVLGIFLLVPAALWSFQMIRDDAFYRTYFVLLPPAICLYFNNTYWLFPRFVTVPGLSYAFVWRLLVSAFLYSFPLIGFLLHLNIPSFAWGINFIILLTVITPVSWILYMQQKDKIQELMLAERALTKSTADLQFLRSQLNPHFLFNILNTLYGTALIDGSKRTAQGIQMLGDMMRFMLNDNHLDFIPLDRELHYLRSYIALQRLRIQDSVLITIQEQITAEDYTCQIVPMLLIPFVENAFKHGINVNQLSWIDISLVCSHQQISLKVRNSVHAQEADDPEKKYTGIGLQNVKERLELFYKERYQLEYAVSGDEFIAELVIKP